METVPIQFSISQILALTKQLPKEVKAMLIKTWLKELNGEAVAPALPGLDMEGFDEPFDLDKAALTKEDIKKLQALWKDEPSAEELAKMLTP